MLGFTVMLLSILIAVFDMNMNEHVHEGRPAAAVKFLISAAK